MRKLCLAVFLALLIGGPAAADQNDPRLPKLFAQLAAAPTHEFAEIIEFEIWQIWIQHPDPVILQLMENAGRAMAVDDWAVAQRALDQVVVLAPDYAEGWNRRATLYFLMDRIEDSLADIDEVLALEPRHFGALSGQGLCYMAQERLEEAAGSFTRALEINPQMRGARDNLDWIEEQIGDDI